MIGVLGRIVDGKNKLVTVGYVLVDSSTNQITRLSKVDTYNLLVSGKFQFMNAYVDGDRIMILGRDKLNVYDLSGKLISKAKNKSAKCNVLAIKRFSDDSGNVLGYRVVDAYGRIKDVNIQQLISLYNSGVELINLRVYNNKVGLIRFNKIDTELVNRKGNIVTKGSNKGAKVEQSMEDKIKLYKKLAGRYGFNTKVDELKGFEMQYRYFTEYDNKSKLTIIYWLCKPFRGALKAVANNKFGDKYKFHYKYGLKALQDIYPQSYVERASKLMYFDRYFYSNLSLIEKLNAIVIYKAYLKDFVRYRFYMLLRHASDNGVDIIRLKAFLSTNTQYINLLDNMNTDEDFYTCVNFVRKLEKLVLNN